MTQPPTLNNTILEDNMPRVSSECPDQICSVVPPSKTATLPISFDLRVKYPGLIGGALSQGACSACWSFSAATAFGDRIRIFSRNGTSARIFLEDLADNRFIARWAETNIKSDGQFLLRSQVTIPYRLYDTISIGGRQVPGIVPMPVLDTLSPTYLAACDICELPFDLSSRVGTYLRSRGTQCSKCCDGGILMYAYVFLVLNGCISLRCDPVPEQFVCSGWTGCIPYKAKNIYKISLTNYTTTTERRGSTVIRTQRQAPLRPDQYQSNMIRIMSNVMDYGTVSASMETYTNFKTGTSGFISLGNGLMLYHQTSGQYTGGHAVCIVGWGTATVSGSTILYWVCRNSWSINWLKDIKPKGQPDLNPGYFAILRGSNFCGIEEDVYGATPFAVYDILDSQGNEKLIPVSQRPSRSVLESLPCRNRPPTQQGQDDVNFVTDCSQCKKGSQMCLKYESDGSISTCRISKY